MSYQLQLSNSAIRDLNNAINWYNDQREGLGDKFKVAVNGIFRYITSSPKIFQLRYKEVRMAKIGGYPFGIFFITEEEEKKIIVVGVIHNKRNPKVIFQREP